MVINHGMNSQANLQTIIQIKYKCNFGKTW